MLIGLTVAALLLGSVVGYGVGSVTGDERSDSPTQSTAGPSPSVVPVRSSGRPSSLAVLSAEALTATAPVDGRQTVTITGVAPDGVWFTDRPARAAGSRSTDDILGEFFAKNPDDPPNVTISGLDRGSLETRVVELADPRWSGGSLTFTSSPLDGDPLGVIPGGLTDISMTIDTALNQCFVALQQDPGASPSGNGPWLGVTNVVATTSYGYYDGGSTMLSGAGGWAGADTWSGSWTGSFAEGCGGTVTADVVSYSVYWDALQEQKIATTAIGAVTVEFGNPEIGSDWYSITSSGSVTARLDTSSETSGYSPIWRIDIGG